MHETAEHECFVFPFPMPIRRWHLQFDNPDFLGWLVVTFYLAAGLCCGRTALKEGRNDSKNGSLQPWWWLAGILVFLGINKQLNLQTLMIDLGRRAAFVGGWSDRRRFVQAVFCIAFALAVLASFSFLALRAKWFIKENPLAFIGIGVLALFVVVRASTINHGDQLLGIDLRDKAWAWILEVCGSVLIAVSAVAGANRYRSPS